MSYINWDKEFEPVIFDDGMKALRAAALIHVLAFDRDDTAWIKVRDETIGLAQDILVKTGMAPEAVDDLFWHLVGEDK